MAWLGSSCCCRSGSRVLVLAVPWHSGRCTPGPDAACCWTTSGSGGACCCTRGFSTQQPRCSTTSPPDGVTLLHQLPGCLEVEVGRGWRGEDSLLQLSLWTAGKKQAEGNFWHSLEGGGGGGGRWKLGAVIQFGQKAHLSKGWGKGEGGGGGERVKSDTVRIMGDRVCTIQSGSWGKRLTCYKEEEEEKNRKKTHVSSTIWGMGFVTDSLEGRWEWGLGKAAAQFGHKADLLSWGVGWWGRGAVHNLDRGLLAQFGHKADLLSWGVGWWGRGAVHNLDRGLLAQFGHKADLLSWGVGQWAIGGGGQKGGLLFVIWTEGSLLSLVTTLTC